MPSLSQMTPGRFLKKEDFPKPTLLTISEWTHENVAREDEAPEKKWVIHFRELDRGVACGPVQLGEIFEAIGVDSSKETATEDAIGKKIVAYNNPNIMMGPKRVGGIRFKAPQVQTQAQESEAPAEDASVPF